MVPSLPARLAQLALLSVVAAGALGCMTATLPPPPAPSRVEPELPDPPSAPPAPSHGRVVLDTEGESATVSRVTETQALYGPATQYKGYPAAPLLRQEELLCVTPCAVDLRQGAHQFVFKSRVDPVRVSTAEVVVSSKPLFVRHTLGREARMSGTFVSGAALLLAGIGATLIGGGLSGIGAMMPETDKNGVRTSSDGLLTAGLVTLAIGAVLGTTGGFMMGYARPAEQPGATTQWRRD